MYICVFLMFNIIYKKNNMYKSTVYEKYFTSAINLRICLLHVH